MPTTKRKPQASRASKRGRAHQHSSEKASRMDAQQAATARAALMAIVDKIRNKARIARECGVKHQALQGWIARGYCPDDHVAKLSNLAAEFGLCIPPWALRPDKITPELIACIRAHTS